MTRSIKAKHAPTKPVWIHLPFIIRVIDLPHDGVIKPNAAVLVVSILNNTNHLIKQLLGQSFGRMI